MGIKKTNINISLNIFQNLSQSLKLFFLLALLVMLVMDGLAIKDSLFLMVSSQDQVAPSRTTTKVRINFTDYDAIVKRIQGAAYFQPSNLSQNNPFKSQ